MSKDDESERGKNKRKDDKWWIPTPKVPPNGLSEVTRKWLQFQKDSVHQVLKAAMAINAQVVSEMEIPENYIDSLPKVKKQNRFPFNGVCLQNFSESAFKTPDFHKEYIRLSFCYIDCLVLFSYGRTGGLALETLYIEV